MQTTEMYAGPSATGHVKVACRCAEEAVEKDSSEESQQKQMLGRSQGLVHVLPAISALERGNQTLHEYRIKKAPALGMGRRVGSRKVSAPWLAQSGVLLR